MFGTTMWMTTGTAIVFLASLFFAAVPQTPDSRLIESARQGQTESVVALLASGAEVNFKDEGWTALMMAAYGGYSTTVRVLLDGDADVSERNLFGSTALTHAAMAGHTTTVKLLLEPGAQVTPGTGVAGPHL